MKLNLEELHYISIIVDSIVDTEGLVNDDILDRRSVDNFIKDWIKSYKEKNNIKSMKKDDFLRVSDKCINEYHLNNIK